jgi:DNA-binding IclR family transcriptional regulator
MEKILQYLKKHGESLDVNIATAAGIPLATARTYLTELASKGVIMAYQSTRFQDGKKIKGIRCRLSGFVPPATPGRKPKA